MKNYQNNKKYKYKLKGVPVYRMNEVYFFKMYKINSNYLFFHLSLIRKK